MRFDSQKSFPYPVLRPDIDDYLNAEFQVVVNVKGVNANKQISAEIKVALSSDEIRKQIDSGHAAIAVVFSCRDTYFREAVTTNKYELTKKFESGQFRGEVVVYPFVVVVKPIKAFSAKGINPEFSQSTFSYDIGEVLAADEPKIVYIDRELFKPISSILQLVKKDTLKGFEWQIAFDEDKLQILLSPEAADERLWAMLSHTVLLKHARARWPIPKKDDDAIKFIATHFFAKTQRDLERNNVGSRLWWMGHLCARIEGMDLHESLKLFLYRADVRANIVERPTTAQSVPVFSALIAQLGKSYSGKQKLFERTTFRNLMVRLNGLGGYRLLDALERKAVEKLIDEVIANELNLSSV